MRDELIEIKWMMPKSSWRTESVIRAVAADDTFEDGEDPWTDACRAWVRKNPEPPAPDPRTSELIRHRVMRLRGWDGGAYHGVLRTHGVEVVDLDPVTNRYECYVCRRRLRWTERIFVAEDLTPLCLNCATGARTVEAHADVYYHCDKPWHDMYDHPSMVCQTSHLHRMREKDAAAFGTSPIVSGAALDAHQFPAIDRICERTTP